MRPQQFRVTLTALALAVVGGLAATSALGPAHAQTPTATATRTPTATGTSTPPPAPARSTPPLFNPEALYRGLSEATNRGDLAAVMAYFADDAELLAPPLCSPDPCRGKAAIQREYQALIAARIRGTILAVESVAGGIRVREEHAADPIRAAGFERVRTNVTVTFTGDGKVSRLALAFDLTDDQSAAYAHFINVQNLLRSLNDARNRGAPTAAYFTEDAVFVGGPACTAANPCIGGAAVQDRFQRLQAQGERATLLGVQVSGNRVTFALEVRNSTTAAAGVDRIVVGVTAELRDGRISRWQATMDATDPQTATVITYNQVVALFNQLFAARNRGDAAGAAALFVEDVYFEGGTCAPCTTRAGVEASFASQARQGTQFQLTGLEVSGNNVVLRQQGGGIATVVRVEVREGRIASWRVTERSGSTPSQLAPAAMPRTGTGGLLHQER